MVLANLMLDLFGVASFEYLAKHMRDPALGKFHMNQQEIPRKQGTIPENFANFPISLTKEVYLASVFLMSGPSCLTLNGGRYELITQRTNFSFGEVGFSALGAKE